MTGSLADVSKAVRKRWHCHRSYPGHRAEIDSRSQKRQRAGAPQNASRHSRVIRRRASVLDCGGPPPLFTACRAGWVGCNIDLYRIPLDARIAAVRAGEVVPEEQVRALFRRVKPLEEISVNERGWTLDVLNLVRRISGRSSERQFAHSKGESRLTSAATGTFMNEDLYAFERELENLHPTTATCAIKSASNCRCFRLRQTSARQAKLLLHVGGGL